MTERRLWSRFLHGLWIGVLLLIGLDLLGTWLLCLAIKQDTLEADRDRLDYDPGCDPISLRNAGRQGRDA